MNILNDLFIYVDSIDKTLYWQYFVIY